MISIDQCNLSTVSDRLLREQLLNACEQVAGLQWLSDAGERLVYLLEPDWHVDLGVAHIRIHAKDVRGKPLPAAVMSLS